MMQNPFEMLQKAEMLFREGRHKDALELLYHGEKLALKDKRPDTLAKICGEIGEIQMNLGNFKDAKKYFEQALKISERLHVKGSSSNIRAFNIWVATIQNNLGNLLRDMGRFEDAKIRYEQALKKHESLLKKDPEIVEYQSNVATTLNNLGTLLIDTGRFEEAKIRYERALKIHEALLKKDPDNVQYMFYMAMTINNLGNLLRVTGRLDDAKIRHDQALKIYEALLKKDPENVQYQSHLTRYQNNLGVLLSDMGRFEDAKIRYDQALAICEAMLKKESENVQFQSYVAITQNNLGNLLSVTGRLDDAKVRLEQTLKIHEGLLKKDSENVQYQSNVASTQNNIGNLLRVTGRLDDAKIKYEQALKIHEALLKKDPENVQYQSYVATTQNNLGNTLRDIGRLEDAKIKYEQALKMREALLKKDHENAQYQLYVATTQNNLGALLNDEGNLSKAMDYLSKALDHVTVFGNPDLVFRIFYSRAICHEKMGNLDQAYSDYKESIERIELIRSHFSLEEYKFDIMKDKESVYSKIISFLCIKENDPGKAWEYVGRVKSRTLLENLSRIELQVPSNIPEDLQSKEKNLLESIRTLDRQARKAKKVDQASLLSQEITKQQLELDKLYDQIVDFAPEYVDLRRGQPLSKDGIADLLKKQGKKTAFVEFYTTPEKVFIFVMQSIDSKPKAKIVNISLQDLKKYVNRYFQEIADFPQTGRETWQELAEYLIAPLMEDINGCEIIYLIPHGLLHYLPLQALSINGKRLIEYFPIAYASSLTAIKYAQRKEIEMFNSCLSIGFTPNENEKDIFEGEASLIANLFKTKAYLDRNASSQLLTNIESDVIHISCHGSFD